MRKYYYLIIIILFSTCVIYAQENNKVLPVPPLVSSQQKTMKQLPVLASMQETERIQHAWVSSLVIPGLGQIYNKHYWKVFVIYLGLILFSRNAYNQHKQLFSYEQLVRESQKNKNDIKKNEAILAKRVRDCIRVRALYIMFSSAWYVINVLDAYAGAHMRTFSLSKDIGMVVLPEMEASSSKGANVGLNVTLNFIIK